MSAPSETRVRELLNSGLSLSAALALATSEAEQDAAIEDGGGAPVSGLLAATVTITGIQMRTLATTPIEIIPAAGAGKIISVISATAREMSGSVAQAANQAVRFCYAGTDHSVLEFPETLGAGMENNFAIAAVPMAFIQPGFMVDNVAVVIDTEGDYGGSGDIAVRVIAHYIIEDYT